MSTFSSTLDPYAILGVSHDASLEDIKQAYRRLALQHHPDKNDGDTSSTENFKRIVAAWEILSDAEKRRAYDATCPRNTPMGSGYEEWPEWSYSVEIHTRELLEAARQRQDWLAWVAAQDLRIERKEERLRSLNQELAELDRQDKLAEDILAPLWWIHFTSGEDNLELSDDIKQEVEHKGPQRRATRRTKVADKSAAESELLTLKKQRMDNQASEMERIIEVRNRTWLFETARQRKFDEELEQEFRGTSKRSTEADLSPDDYTEWL